MTSEMLEHRIGNRHPAFLAAFGVAQMEAGLAAVDISDLERDGFADAKTAMINQQQTNSESRMSNSVDKLGNLLTG